MLNLKIYWVTIPIIFGLGEVPTVYTSPSTELLLLVDNLVVYGFYTTVNLL